MGGIKLKIIIRHYLQKDFCENVHVFLTHFTSFLLAFIIYDVNSMQLVLSLIDIIQF